MRGRYALNQDPVVSVQECLKVKIGTKGRNSELLKQRNLAIVYRYYFYKSFTKWKYEAIIEKVSEEMYLTNRTITEILTAQVEELREIKADQPPIVRLSRKFPQYNWSISAVADK